MNSHISFESLFACVNACMHAQLMKTSMQLGVILQSTISQINYLESLTFFSNNERLSVMHAAKWEPCVHACWHNAHKCACMSLYLK